MPLYTTDPMEPSTDLTTTTPPHEITVSQPNPFTVRTIKEAMELADIIAQGGMFGLKQGAQVLTLMKLAQDENTTLAALLKRYHVFEDGKISQRADYTQGQFTQSGGRIMWHARTESICAATFRLTDFDDSAQKRAHERFEAMWSLEGSEKPEDRTALILEIAKLSVENEVTIIRTMEDAIEKGITEGKHGRKTNWKTSPRQMLHARVVTEGIRAIYPGLVAGVYSEDEVMDIQKAEAEQQLAERQERRAQMTEKEKLEWMINEKIEKSKLAATDSDKSRLLGEAAELRTELFEKFPPDAPKTPASDSGGMDTAPTGVNEAPDGTAAQGATGELALPGAETTVEPPPEPRWQEYKIQCIKVAAYKGKRLEELTADEIDVLYTKRSLPNLENPDKKIRTEAKMIELAYKKLHENDK